MRNAVLMPLHLDVFVGQNLTFSHQISVQLKTSEHFLAHFFVFWAQFLTKRRHFRPDPFLSCAERWQDLCAVHDSRGPCSEKGPFLARSSRGVSSDGDLRGFSDTWRAHLAKASSFRMHGARILPRTGDFPVRGHFRDAWSAKPATDCRPGTHRGETLPRIDARERTAREYCHCQSGQERIRAQSRHRRTLGGGRISRAFRHRRAPGNASRHNLATTSRPRTHFAHILPSPGAWERIASISCHRQTSENAQLRHTATASRPVAQRSPREGVGSGPWLRCGVRRATLSVQGSGHSAFSGLNCWERFRVCAVSVGNHEPASRSAKLCRIMC